MTTPPEHRKGCSNSREQELLESLKSMMFDMKADLDKLKTEQLRRSSRPSESDDYRTRRRKPLEYQNPRNSLSNPRDPLVDLEIKISPFHGTLYPKEYLQWKRNMEDWFYCNRIPEEQRLRHAVRQLAGDAHKWWIEEVDYRRFHNEPTITTWKELKTLLRDQYAPRHEVHTASPRKERVQKNSSAFHHSTDSPKPSKTPTKLSSKPQEKPPAECTDNPSPKLPDKQMDLVIESNPRHKLFLPAKTFVSDSELTILEPVQPSYIVPIPQDFRDEPPKESSGETRQSSSLVTHVEPSIQLVPEPPPLLFPLSVTQAEIAPENLISLAPEQPRSLVYVPSAFEPELIELEPAQPSSLVFSPQVFEKKLNSDVDTSSGCEEERLPETELSLVGPVLKPREPSDPDSRVIIIIPELTQHLLELSETSNLIYYWLNFITVHSFKLYAYKLASSNIIHLVYPMSVQKKSGALGKLQCSGTEDALEITMAIKENTPDLRQSQLIQRAMSGIGDSTVCETTLSRDREGKSTCSFQLKEKPPDVPPPDSFGPRTSINPTSINPTSINPTSITPTSINPTSFGKKIIVSHTIIPRYTSLPVQNFKRKKLFRGCVFDRDKLYFVGQKLLIHDLEYYDPYDYLFRVIVGNSQENGQPIGHYRRIFDPGVGSSFQTETQDLPSTAQHNSHQREHQGMHYLCYSPTTDLVPFIAGDTDLRTNPFQLGEDDVNLTEEPELEPDQDQEITEEPDLSFPAGPVTRARQVELQTTLRHLLHSIPTRLTHAGPTTLVVIQAV